MADFIYSAVDVKGRSMDGIMSAESETDLDLRLQELGYWLIDASQKNLAKNKFSGKKVPRRELVDFFNGLNSMLAAGIPISNSIDAIAEETELESFAMVLRDLKLNVEVGNTLDDAMSKHPSVFNHQITNLIKAGEYSGNLGQACEDISEHLEWLDGIMGDIKQASIYPILIFTAVMGLVFLMFTFVVPRFSKIFDSMKIELPPLTKAVVSIGDFTSANWDLILLVPTVLVLFLKYGPKIIPGMGYVLDGTKLNLPIFGKLNRMIVQSRFCHNLGLLLKSGVPILEALSLCKGLVGNRVMEKAVLDAELCVTEGRKMTEALRKHNIISPIVLRMMVVGEETGRLDRSLEYASVRFDKEVPRQIKRVFGVLEPLIMLILISIVGLIGGAVFLPMFSMMSGLGN